VMLKQDICNRYFNQNSQLLCKRCDSNGSVFNRQSHSLINLDYQQGPAAFQDINQRYSNKTVKHKVSTTLVEQSLIANMFQTFIPLLLWGYFLKENSTKKQLHRFAASVVTLLK